MYRSLLTLAFTAPLLAAPVPKDAPKSSIYSPTQAGAKLVYEFQAGSDKWEVIDTITKVEVKDEEFLVTTSRSGGAKGTSGTSTFTRRISSKGVYQVSAEDDIKSAPMLTLPAKPGDTWSHEVPASPVKKGAKSTYTVGKQEMVDVPAGKFEAIPVEMVLEYDDRVTSNTNWYATGIGVVKSKMKSGNFERLTVLKSCTPAK